MARATSPDTGTKLETVTSVDGTEIAFERTGNGPPLVLVHGGGTDHGFWERSDVRPTHAEHCTVYAMDCHGVGQSGDVRESGALASQPESRRDSGNATVYELAREFEDVAAVVDAIG